MNKFLATASTLALLLAGPALASEAPRDAATTGASATQATTQATPGQAVEQRQQMGQIDTDEMIGRNIENAAGDRLGEVNSVILGQDGQVEAVIVGVGGFLGIGQRDVAIEWEQLNISEGGEHITANMTREQLEALPEYEFADTQQRGGVFQRDTAGMPAGERRMDARTPAADRAATTTAADRPATEGTATAVERGDRPASPAADAQPMRDVSHLSADELIGKDVRNLRGENVGNIEDIVLDQNEGSFAVISVGGFLGIGARDVAVPLDELQLGDDDVIMMSETTEEQLREMPEYDETQYQRMDGATQR
jgi:sporulation protein YlmC with PRC-barrel domain